MVVVFFGTPQFAVPTLEQLLASSHRVCGVVTQPDRARGRGQKISDAPVKALALERGLPVIQPERLRDPDVLETLRRWAPDLGVVIAYGTMIPDELLAVPTHGMINVHGSLLPRYRGAAPVHRAVINGEPETGVTIQRVVRELDAGAMLGRVARPIGPDETSEEIRNDLSAIGARLLVEVVDRIERGSAVEEPQDPAAVTLAPKLTKEEGLLDWGQPALAVHNRVRGLHPWPHAYTYLDGARLILLRTHLVPGRTGEAPGTVVEAGRDAIHVAAGDGVVVAIDELQPEGRRPMRARDFLAGRPLARGARLTRP